MTKSTHKMGYLLNTMILLAVLVGCKPLSSKQLEKPKKDSGDISISISKERVNTVQNGTFIKDKLWGFNTANLFYHTTPYETDFNALMDSLDPVVLRFPGGTVANFSHPTGKGYGFVASDIETIQGSQMYHKMKKSLDRESLYIKNGKVNTNFIEPYASLASRHSIKTIYVANLLTATVQETIDAVQYLQNEGIEVIGIELGNEYYLPAYRQTFPTVDSYIDVAKNASQQLRQVFPDIPLGVIATPTSHVKDMKNPVNIMHYKTWNEKLAMETFYDAYIVHLYSMPIECAQAKNKLECALDYNNRYIFSGVKDAYEEYNKLFGDKKMWITEWNFGETKHFGNSFLQGVYYAEYGLMTLGYINNGIVCHHNLMAKGSGFNIIDANAQAGSACAPKINYKVQSFFKTLWEGNYVYADHFGDSSASYSWFTYYDKQAKTCCVMVINKSGADRSIGFPELDQQSVKDIQVKSIVANSMNDKYAHQAINQNVRQFENRVVPSEKAINISGYSINQIIVQFK